MILRALPLILLTILSQVTWAQDGDVPFRIKTVVIDAGHGGKDPGNLGTGRHKWREKDVALDVALRTGKYIKEQFPEINVIYTRDSDVFIGLNDRADIANSNKADIFISIHCNAIEYPSARGVETYALGLHKNEENLQVAMKENAAIKLEEDYEQKYEGFDPNSPESIIALTMMQSAFLDQSLRISSYIQKQFKERVGRRDRGVKQAGFLVLRRTTMPSILIELGFLTNPEEEDFLNTESGRVYMSSAILRGFKEYKETVEGPLEEGTAGSGESPKEDETKEMSVDLKQAELRAELERKKAELAKQQGIDLAAEEARKAKEDSLRIEAEKKAAAEKRKAEEAAQKEAQRIADEQAAKLAEETRLAEEAALAELERKAKEAEEARLAEEKNQREAALEAARLVAEKEQQAKIDSENLAKQAEIEQILQDSKTELEKKEPQPELRAAQQEEERKARLEELRIKKAEVEARLAKLNESKELINSGDDKLEQKEKPLKKEKPVEASVPVNDNSGLVFKIQIHTATKAMPLLSPLFRDVPVWEYQQDGLFKYTTGDFKSADDATPVQNEMREMGFKGAFVVAFQNGQRIKVSEARKLLNQ